MVLAVVEFSLIYSTVMFHHFSPSQNLSFLILSFKYVRSFLSSCIISFLFSTYLLIFIIINKLDCVNIFKQLIFRSTSSLMIRTKITIIAYIIIIKFPIRIVYSIIFILNFFASFLIIFIFLLLLLPNNLIGK